MAAALTLTFADPAGRTETRGPFPVLVLAGETMRAGALEAPFAVHENHHWCVGSRKFLRAECPGPLAIRFERPDGHASTAYGPFDSLSFVDGVAYADRAVFAFVDRSLGDWYCHRDGRHWAMMIVTPR